MPADRPAPANAAVKPPRSLLDNLFAFPPNRAALGGTAYLIVRNAGSVLVDCPVWEASYLDFARSQQVRWLFLTHRSAHAAVAQWQQALDCAVVVQEQEAYLLPEVEVTPFAEEATVAEDCQGIWTCGHSPGSACLYVPEHGGVLFSGRHLLPEASGRVAPLRTAKTFHWPRQLRQVETLRTRFSPDTLAILCPGANTGFLRGRGFVTDAYAQLARLDLDALRPAPVGL